MDISETLDHRDSGSTYLDVDRTIYPVLWKRCRGVGLSKLLTFYNCEVIAKAFFLIFDDTIDPKIHSPIYSPLPQFARMISQTLGRLDDVHVCA